LHARVRLLAEREDDLATLVEELNRHVRASSPGNRFITMFMMVLDPMTGKYTYSNAGHNPPIIVRESGRVERLETGGLILGILPQAKYEVAEGRLMPGDVVVIFSDGVTEAPKPGTDDEFGEARLEDVVISHRESRATEIQMAVVQALAAWTGESGAVDDVTLVVARRPPVAHLIPSTPTGG
jgi:sigma-B regulation protein RsbU (phosphoserine phosphatase)